MVSVSMSSLRIELRVYVAVRNTEPAGSTNTVCSDAYVIVLGELSFVFLWE